MRGEERTEKEKFRNFVLRGRAQVVLQQREVVYIVCFPSFCFYFLFFLVLL